MTVRFATTLWDRVRQAQSGRETALNDVLEGYRPPLVRYLRECGLSGEDAEDVVQEILLTLTREGIIERADERLGRFRSLLLVITRNHLKNHFRFRNAAKRGGGFHRSSLEEVAPESDIRGGVAVVSAPGDESFDRAWMDHILQVSLQRLREESPEGHRLLDQLLRGECTYRQMADQRGKTEDWVDHQVRLARRKLAGFVRAEVLNYSSSIDEYRDELAHLSRFLKDL